MLNADNDWLKRVSKFHPKDDAESAIERYGAIPVARRGKGRGDKDREKGLGCMRKEMKAV